MKKFLKRIGVGGVTAALAFSGLLGLAGTEAIASGQGSGVTSGGGGYTSSSDRGTMFLYVGVPGAYNDDSAAINYLTAKANSYFWPRTNLQNGSSGISNVVKNACDNARADAGGGSDTKTVLVQVALNSSDYSSGRYGAYGSNKANFISNFNGNYNTINSKLSGLSDKGGGVKNRHSTKISGVSSPIKASCTVARKSELVPPEYKGSIKMTVSDTKSVNEVHSYSTVASSQILADENDEAFYEVNSKVTHFGKVYDDYIKIEDPTKSQYDKFLTDAKAAAALDKSSPIELPTVNLTAANQTKLAKGGVLNVSQSQKKQSFSASSTREFTANFEKCSRSLGNSTTKTFKTEQEATTYLNNVYSNYGCKQQTENGKKVNYKTTSSKAKEWAVSPKPTTPQEIGFWQSLVVHCNSTGFKSALSSLGENATDIPQPSSEIYTGALNTKKFSNRTQAKSALGGLLGETTGEYSYTGERSFFDKECPFECEPDTSVNIGEPGAKAEGETGADFSMFRDNTDRTIEIRRWIPSNKGGVTYDGSKALTTTVSIDPSSTPGTKPTSSQGGKFTLTNKEGENVFGDGKVETQKNWDEGLFKSSTSGVLRGESTEFKAKASWASENGKPVRLTFKWEYEPKVATNIPVSGIGFGADGGKLGTNANVGAPIEGKCYSNFDNSSTGIDTTELFLDNTGTGTPNNIDGKIINPAKGRADITITFLRATTS